jgi:hypothetical protein
MSIKTKIPLIDEEENLVDREKVSFDPILSFDLFEIHQFAMQNIRYLVNYYHVWEYGLDSFIVPQVYEFT